MEQPKRIPRVPGAPWPFVKYVWRHIDPVMRVQSAAGMLLTLLVIGSELATVWLVGRLVNVILHPMPADDLWSGVTPLLAALLLLQLLRAGMVRMQEWLDRRVMPGLATATRVLLFNRLLQQSQSFLHNNFAGVLANHVRRAGDVVASMQSRLQYQFIALGARFTGTAVLLSTITPWLALTLGLFVVAAAIAARKLAPVWSKLSEKNAAAASAATGYIVDSTTNLAAVQQNAGWREEQRRIVEAQENWNAASNRRGYFLSWFWGGFDSASAFAYVGFLALVAYGWQRGSFDAGQLAMATALIGQLFQSLSSMVSLLTMRMDDIGILRDSLNKISTPLEVMDVAHAPEIHVTHGEIAFDGISFSYPNGQNVLDGLSITIPAGQHVGIVGLSGAGKTTLMQLLLRAYDVTAGSIRIDGQDISGVTQDSLHRAIAVIPQEPMLFHRSLADNIAYGSVRDEARLRAAAAKAQASGFIEALPQGYDTLVGERGVKLSGGQRQRVAIARAIYRDAPILLLDEATSALDSETERDIQSAMVESMRGRTALVIAHRLSTITHLDRIIVMDRGRIIEDGAFSDLIKAGGMFARLWNLQAGGFLPDTLSD